MMKLPVQEVSTGLTYSRISVNVDFLNVFLPGTVPAIPAPATRRHAWAFSWTLPWGCWSPWPPLCILFLLAGFKMFAVGVGNAVEDELREIASEPVAEHYFYTADFKTINQIGKKLQKKICVGE